jgi:hypothetical protein
LEKVPYHNYFFLGGDEAKLYKNFFKNACVNGAKIIYSWKRLEPKKAQMKNGYPLFHKLKAKLLVSMAIQEPDYTYKNPQTGAPYILRVLSFHSGLSRGKHNILEYTGAFLFKAAVH